MIEREYYGNGQLNYEIPYNHQQQKHGTAKWWYSDGKPMYECPYYRGQYHGIEKRWLYDEQLNYEHYYLYGKQVTPEEYREHELVEILSGL